MSKETYRPDIDGLRAVAVLAVVIYHAFPKALPGGFVGVDIFFVISGYLISGILFKSLSNGTFSFAEFYSRRIRRIFPALMLVLVLNRSPMMFLFPRCWNCFYSRASRGRSHRSNALSFQGWILLFRKN